MCVCVARRTCGDVQRAGGGCGAWRVRMSTQGHGICGVQGCSASSGLSLAVRQGAGRVLGGAPAVLEVAVGRRKTLGASEAVGSELVDGAVFGVAVVCAYVTVCVCQPPAGDLCRGCEPNKQHAWTG